MLLCHLLGDEWIVITAINRHFFKFLVQETAGEDLAFGAFLMFYSGIVTFMSVLDFLCVLQNATSDVWHLNRLAFAIDGAKMPSYFRMPNSRHGSNKFYMAQKEHWKQSCEGNVSGNTGSDVICIPTMTSYVLHQWRHTVSGNVSHPTLILYQKI